MSSDMHCSEFRNASPAMSGSMRLRLMRDKQQLTPYSSMHQVLSRRSPPGAYSPKQLSDAEGTSPVEVHMGGYARF